MNRLILLAIFHVAALPASAQLPKATFSVTEAGTPAFAPDGKPLTRPDTLIPLAVYIQCDSLVASGIARLSGPQWSMRPQLSGTSDSLAIDLAAFVPNPGGIGMHVIVYRNWHLTLKPLSDSLRKVVFLQSAYKDPVLMVLNIRSSVRQPCL